MADRPGRNTTWPFGCGLNVIGDFDQPEVLSKLTLVTSYKRKRAVQMCIKKCFTGRIIVSLVLVCAFLPDRPSVVVADEKEAAAQTEADALAATETKLEELFKEMDLFYKVGKTETGSKIITIMYENQGATSKITCAVRPIGTYGGKTVYAVSAWIVVSQTESALPPNVIKLVATDNDSLLLGSYSMSQNFQMVYSNGSIPFDEATSAKCVLMCLLYTHDNSVNLKKKIDAIGAAAPSP